MVPKGRWFPFLPGVKVKLLLPLAAQCPAVSTVSLEISAPVQVPLLSEDVV